MAGTSWGNLSGVRCMCGGFWQALSLPMSQSKTKTLYFLRVRAREGPPGGGRHGASNTDSNLYIWELPIWAKTVPYTRTKTVRIYIPAGSTLILYVDSQNVKPENFFA